jgi:hypothetical protein
MLKPIHFRSVTNQHIQSRYRARADIYYEQCVELWSVLDGCNSKMKITLHGRGHGTLFVENGKPTSDVTECHRYWKNN